MKKNSNTLNHERVQKVNKLLKKVFGNLTQGNLMDYDTFPLPKQNHLQFIAKGIKLPGLYKLIGQFTKKDGSEIKVLPIYIEAAKNYAKLYQKEFGKKVEIISDSCATQGTTCF